MSSQLWFIEIKHMVLLSFYCIKCFYDKCRSIDIYSLFDEILISLMSKSYYCAISFIVQFNLFLIDTCTPIYYVHVPCLNKCM